jgi:hypothetical protein
VATTPIERILCDRHLIEFAEGGEMKRKLIRQLLLIRLTQQTPMGSVEGCPDRRFPKRCGNFKATSPPRKPANSTSRPVAGPKASSAPDANIGERTNW